MLGVWVLGVLENWVRQAGFDNLHRRYPLN
jgi:hypothetical protein